jgi:methylmalonyl-CoA mutase cobalamin-binding domain/chain
MRLTDRKRTSVVVFAGEARASDRGAQALTAALSAAGIEILYLGRQSSAREIATCAAEVHADAIEVCVAGGGGVRLLRELLRELNELDRACVSIVVHRVQ